MLPYFGIYVRVCTGMRMSSPDAFSCVRERVSVGVREDRASLYHRGCAWVRVCLFLGPRGHEGYMGSCIPALALIMSAWVSLGPGALRGRRLVACA